VLFLRVRVVCTHTTDMNVWSRLLNKGILPSARSGHTLVWYRPAGDDDYGAEDTLKSSRRDSGHLYLFGGCDAATGSHSVQPFYRYALGTSSSYSAHVPVVYYQRACDGTDQWNGMCRVVGEQIAGNGR
jgi:hypothetical protein